ncbi:hypothetical protein [Desulfitibacter alkalitolerans]|uniref:hypothetical protein n=1 Tax=Desulfitibacter alkalitolerans TaxID=264641 RepID=UPI000480F1B4|nr:hypothetical protein [Desulfitibacter alkalitolerans]
MKKWYEALFENYGKNYDNENFTQGTIGECDFIEKELNYNKSISLQALAHNRGKKLDIDPALCYDIIKFCERER